MRTCDMRVVTRNGWLAPEWENSKAIVSPIEILQSQPTHLAHPQSVDREEEEKGSVPDLGSPVAFCAGAQLLDMPAQLTNPYFSDSI